MNTLHDTLVEALYRIRKAGTNLLYPITDDRLEEVITNLLDKYELHCKVKPRIRAKKLKKEGTLENTSTILDMILIHPNSDFTTPTSVSLYFDSYLNEKNIPEFSISARFHNKYKDAIYRPRLVSCEEDVRSYVNVLLDDLSHNKLL